MAATTFKSLRRPCAALFGGLRRVSSSGPVPRTAVRTLAAVATHTVQPTTFIEDYSASLINMGYNFHHIDNVENLEQYRYGGFHPVTLGETINDRYLVLNKLGHGGYSTVWLAWDVVQQKYAALKIALADFGEDLSEVDIVQRLAADGESHPGKGLIRHVTDSFHFDGPNGRHTCLVNAPAMMTLRHAKDASYSQLFQLSSARAIAAQVVQAVCYLHAKGVVHGDLHLANILFQLPQRIASLTPDQFHQQHNQPEIIPVTRLDGLPLDETAPPHAVLPVWLGQPSEDVTPSDAKVLLGDFGESYMPSQEVRRHCNTPIRYRAPEAQFPDGTPPLSFSSDIWSLGCLLWGVVGQNPLFDPWVLSEDEVLNDQTDLLGDIPTEWSMSLRQSHDYGYEETTPKSAIRIERAGWQERWDRCVQQAREESSMEEISEEEKEAFLDMMKKMIVFRPEERTTAREVYESRWMQEWALPELKKARKSSTV